MGCRTGFYLLMRGSTADNEKNLAALKNALKKIIDHKGAMPGARRRECGNFRALSVAAAKAEAVRYLNALNAREQSFVYSGDVLDGGI
jgi:S-ribosylhomocysteine lyase